VLVIWIDWLRSPSTNPKLRFKRFEHHLTTARLDLAADAALSL